MGLGNALRWSAFILVAGGCPTANADAPQRTILQCVGDMWGEGIKAPKDAAIPSGVHDVPGTFTIKDNELIQSGGGGQASDSRYDLCSTTSTTYVFSTDCTVLRAQYIEDWLEEKDFNIETSPFFKKYKRSSWLSVETVMVDRVNLRVNEEQLTGHSGGIYDKAGRKVVYKPFLVSVRYQASCKLGTPKI